MGHCCLSISDIVRTFRSLFPGWRSKAFFETIKTPVFFGVVEIAAMLILEMRLC